MIDPLDLKATLHPDDYRGTFKVAGTARLGGMNTYGQGPCGTPGA